MGPKRKSTGNGSKATSHRKTIKVDDKPQKRLAVESIRKNVIDKLLNNIKLMDPEKLWLMRQLEISRTGINIPKEPSPLRDAEPDETEPIEIKKTSNRKTQTNEELISGTSTSIGPMEEMKILYRDKRKTEICKDRISELMQQTFPQRRKLVMNAQLLVSQLQELYPILFSFEELKNELDRIFFVGKSELFSSNVKKYSNGILQSTSKLNKLMQKVLYLEATTVDASQKDIVYNTGSLLLLPELLHEKPSFIKINKKISLESYFPHIECPPSCKEILDALNPNGPFKVIVEEQVVCECSTLAEAVLGMFATYFIFNICYPGKCNNTFVLFEKLYLESDDTEIIPKRAKEIMTVLTQCT